VTDTSSSWPRPTHPWVDEARAGVRFAIVGNWLPQWDDLVRFVVRAEQLGFDAYWANDHPNRSLDPWTLLAALAMATTRIRLISLVACVQYRSAWTLARCAADVDRISGGRLVLGVGTGDDTDEFEQLGLPFPPPRERQRMLVETLEEVQRIWAGARLDKPTFRPGPVQEPRVPILIGGGGERVTLRQVARHADVSNLGAHEWAGGAFDVTDVRRKYEVLARHCAEIGRPYESILRSHYTPLVVLAETPAALERKRAAARIPDPHLRTAPLFATTTDAVAHFERLAEAGVQYFLASVAGDDDETVHLLAERVVPALAATR
jgi:alkanesulfonate monooxygenase SsuD/methylene tetrahydromethanopterin reductase-like flavin-dependent oxidoreductase (luciferase family)